MKFRFRRSNAPLRLKSPTAKRKILKLKGINTLRHIKRVALVRNYSADSFGSFAPEKKKGFWRSFQLRIGELRERLRKQIARRINKEPRLPLSTLLRILLVTFSLTALTGAFVIFSFFFTYGGAYTEIKIPSFISLNVNDATSLATDVFEYEIIYESNPNFKSGSVISQRPLPNVTRKIYEKNGKFKITLTVNKENQYITLPQLIGTPLRDALIDLQSAGIKVQIIKEYSPTVSSGIIIHSSLPEGSELKAGDILTLRVSLGKEILEITVPSILGKSEQEAISLLEKKGLLAGEIRYENSEDKMGTVISQSVAPGSSVKEGSKISFSVSGGLYHSSD